ncbi:MAG: MMPL family transporter [Oligoflexia bacterium]|nr:MMPL family transporter [Oligoflexia bacterium]
MENLYKIKIDKNKINYRFSHWIVENPLKSITLSIVLLCVFLPGLLNFQARWSSRIWFDPDHPMLTKLDRFEKTFGNDQYVSIGLSRKDGLFNQTSLALIQELTEKMWFIDDVIRVESMANYNKIQADGDDINISRFLEDGKLQFSAEELSSLRKSAVTDDVMPEFYVSKDTTFTLIFGYLKPSIEKDPNFETVIAQTRKLVAEYKAKYPGHEYYITGAAAGNDSFREISESDNQRLIPFMVLFIFILLYIQFRSFITMVAPLGLMGITVAATYGFMGELGITFNSMLAAIPGVLLAICVADAVHVFNSFFHFRTIGENSKKSIELALIKNFSPTLLTSITTTVSFFSITLSEIAPIRDLGILCGFGTMFAWLMTYTAIGAIVSLFSQRLDKGELKVLNWGKIVDDKIKRDDNNYIATKLAEFVFKFRWPIIIIFVGFVGISLKIALQNEVNSDPIKYFHEKVPVRIAYDVTANKMGGLRGIELVADAGVAEGIKDPQFLKRLEAYIAHIKKDEDITKVKSILEIIKKMNQVLNQNDPSFYAIPEKQKTVAEILFFYTMGLPEGMSINNQFSLDNRRLRLRVTWMLESSKESEAKSKWLEAQAKKFDLNITSEGNAPIYLSMNSLVVKSFFRSMAMALCLVSILLFIVYRDFLVSLLGMLPNLIPLTFGGALMELLDKPIDIGTSIVSTVCLGIAVDDTIHFINSYKNYRSLGHDPVTAVKETLMVTGKALCLTTVLLVVGFGSFVFADFVPNRNFGMLCSLILFLALVTDLIFLPAILFVSEKKEKRSQELSTNP